MQCLYGFHMAIKTNIDFFLHSIHQLIFVTKQSVFYVKYEMNL